MDRTSDRPGGAPARDARPADTGPPRLTLLAVPAYGLLILAVFYTLYFASSLLIPVVAAILLNAVFSPAVRGMARRGVPGPVGAALIVGLLSGILVLSTVLLSTPARDWMGRLPSITWEARDKLQTLMAPVKNVKQATEEVDKLAQAASGEAEGTSKVTIKGPSIMSQVFESLQMVVLQLAVILALLFFLLASGDHFKERFVAMVPGLRGKKQVLGILRKIERDSSRYILTVGLINLALGAAIGTGMWILGLPNAALWGIMAAVLNFMPFVGALVGAAMVFMVALVSVDATWVAMAAPLVYLGCNVLEAQFVTPSILGQSLTVNPVVVFGFILLWGWLWGVPGALMAVPILVVVRAVCDNVESLRLVSLFLKGDSRNDPARGKAARAAETP